MSDEPSLLEKKLAEKPIVVPGNPFWEVFKRFGKDELMAMIVNVAGTAGIEYALAQQGASLSPNARKIILSAAGPVVEKIGFFPLHFKEAWDVYKTTPENEREKLSHYFKSAVKEGSLSLAEDVAVHDPIYFGLMFAGLNLYPQTPAWLMASTSFVAAVVAVSALEVGVTEARYWNLTRKLRKMGFGMERYMESRFFIREDAKAEKVLDSLAREFDLPVRTVGEYNDTYFKTKLATYSGRKPKLRLRERIIQAEQRTRRSAQIVYTRTAELSGKGPSQFNYYPQRKDKFYYSLSQEMPCSMDEIHAERVREYLKGILHVDDDMNKAESRAISFQRSIAFNKEGLFASTDRVQADHQRDFYVVELKVYTDKNLLKEAMRYVMTEFPALHVTHGKADIVAMNGRCQKA